MQTLPPPRMLPQTPVLSPEYGLWGRSHERRAGLAVGLLVAVLFQGGLAWTSNRTHYVPKPKVKETEVAVALSMPKLEAEDPEVVEGAPAPDKVDFAPPMQNDVPQVAAPDSFIVPIEPPPPELTALSSSVVKIPEGRNYLGNVTIIDISQLDQVPRPKFQAAPAYPFEAKRAKLEGSVMVEFIVDTNGNVRNAHALKSSAPIFEDNAVAAVAIWKFSPGRKNGHTVFTHMIVPILFHITDDT